VLTTSTSEAYSFSSGCFAIREARFWSPQPGYPLFDFLAVLDDVR
jgi:alanine-synthesizing transaminase